jgi:DNA (cytosine-5)-methyltransferase 1
MQKFNLGTGLNPAETSTKVVCKLTNIDINPITITRVNTKKTNNPDTNYINLTSGKKAVINILLKRRGYRLIVKFVQYLTKEDKKNNKPLFSITKYVKELIQLGVRTTTKSGIKYFRNKLIHSDVNIKDIDDKPITFGFFSNGMGSNQTAIKELNLEHKFKYSFEIDKFAQQTLSHNFNIENQYGDLFTADAKKLPQVDVITAGFPCQTWSRAGKQAGFNDRRGTIIFKLKDLFIELNSLNKAPKVIFLENVENLVSHDKKNGEFDSIFCDKSFHRKIGHSMYVIETEVFKPLSKYYDITWGIENTLDYGIPHNRVRWFCIMTLKTSKFTFSFDKLREKRVPLRTCLKDYLDPKPMVPKKLFYTANKMIRKEYKNSGALIRVGDIENLTYGQSRRVLSEDGPVSCFTCGENSKYLIGNDVRYLTVSEKLRLQAFPKWFKFDPKTSITQRNKQLGNTMSVNIVKSIFSVVFDKENFKTVSLNVPTHPINNIAYKIKRVA